MKALRQLARLLSLEGSTPQPQQQQHTGTPGGKAHQQQQHTGLPGGKAQQHRDAKAEAKAAAAGAPRPKGPKGPCGTPTSPPAGGAVVPLPLASAMRKGCPPWNVQGGCDLQFVQLLPEGDAIRVSYPAGSGTPSSGKRGGCVLRGAPPCLPATDVLLRFDFRPRPGFEWTRGGKLGGGLHIGQGTAAGYVHSESAASARLVWGPNGACMLYLYPMTGVEQDAAYCTVARLGQGYGDSLFPGTFQAQAGAWNSAVLRVRLNTPGRADGVAGLGLNGQYREYGRMVWRKSADTRITQAIISTFFGGSWATPVDTHIDFANFSLTVLG